MVQHFMEHKEKDENLTLREFLCIHYQDSDVPDDDHEKDMKLPFKSHTSNCSCSIVFYPLLQEFKIKPLIKYRRHKQTLFSYSFFYSSNFHSFIWQPPKIG